MEKEEIKIPSTVLEIEKQIRSAHTKEDLESLKIAIVQETA